ncbi:hypothetical protein NHX12_025398 [Muraenolepis orangiensis]|uniref:Uncharacterized protein n=1 Tax=Muraenolepis orangiensis TaxID=630683 RepID=A0A9Q0IS83_9TELE|nr:hypothetical protein NHX12_025398 [Muraenolepis orangiensis]
MEPQSTITPEPFPTSKPSPSLPSLVLDNSTSTDFNIDIIAANDLISTANHIYAFLAALSLVSACFLLYSFTQTYKAQRRMAWLDCLFGTFCGSQLLLVLLSLWSVAYRPFYLPAPQLACAALSFSVNVASLCGLLLLALMAYVLTFDPPSHALLRRPGVSVSLVALASVPSSVVLAAVRWPGQEGTHCIVDPLANGLSYALAKLCLSFIVPCFLLLGLLIAGCVHQWKSRGRFLSGSEEGPVFLTLAVVLLFCQLFYDVVLLRGGTGPGEDGMAFRKALLSVAESVLFAGSAVSLLLVLFLHRSSRDSLKGALRQVRDCCHSLGGTRAHRHITPPHIEITDTLPDYNS